MNTRFKISCTIAPENRILSHTTVALPHNTVEEFPAICTQLCQKFLEAGLSIPEDGGVSFYPSNRFAKVHCAPILEAEINPALTKGIHRVK